MRRCDRKCPWTYVPFWLGAPYCLNPATQGSHLSPGGRGASLEEP